jgi:hypothetical protein
VKRAALALPLALALGVLGWRTGAARPRTGTAAVIHGVVVDAAGPVEGATVRIQATSNATHSGPGGAFALAGLVEGAPVTVSAWKEGAYCAKVEGVVPPASGITLTLRAYQTTDNPGYVWIAPTGADSCASCKPAVTQVWLENDAHAGSATNARFLTMYNGTDIDGNRSPPTRYACTKDYGCFPLPPDPSLPYYGPGYRLDFPTTAGNCAGCHIPGAALDAPYATDPNTVSGADTFGVHCDFCHKVAEVILDPATGSPYPNMPGVLSMDVRRPFPEDPDRYQLFFGTFDDDNVPEEDTYLPLIEESRWCAPCHSATFWEVPIYTSFDEWLDSPYSDPSYAGARTCQDCHMPAPTWVDGRLLTNVAPGMGAVERDPLTLHAHTFPGAASTELLQNALTLTATGLVLHDRAVVTVLIVNDQTGHHVPTDSPLRHIILLVEATGAGGEVLAQLGGPVVPAWGGEGDATQGYYAGLPGTAYAKVLRELWTEVAPTGAYWNRTAIVSDNRLAAFATDTTTYSFALPVEGTVQVRVTLLFRRAYKQLMDWKGWDVPDITMAQEVWVLPVATTRRYLPLIGGPPPVP